ncbi:hypothetical protein DUNSADRAFT_3852 [Dunaliella salina]|uniref:Ubiquitin carboxyl-terminal hydrolase n=1 Tax=Dunaliella salina TaxID=3046 RepID=A0ABQ7GT69_DUNSA|nr:hypothetical protein DUNSADRAFT_3852 [Dunaliella salina]|eukprot:KAF5837780.1 hypothetical protein DUNSADRAFT_3852 [Dunaliella salina]
MDKQQLLHHSASSSAHYFRPITFIPAVKERGGGVQEPAANNLLIPLNAPFQADQQVQGLSTNQDMPGPLVYGPAPPSTRGAAGGLKSRQELFREEDVQLRWSSVSRAGAGLQNLGNTCFMNSVLQCLAHTPPLAEAVLSGRAQCPPTSNNSDDPLATTLAHIKRVFSTHGIVRPTGQVKTLRTVNKRFRVGRQEDSHEYLRCLLDALHEACLKPFKPKPPPHLVATTFINRIFGARLRSRWYDLYGVLVHLGHSVHSGHYYCFVRAGNGIWHKCDDTQVGQCSERTALGQQAYILFYVRREPRTSSSQTARSDSVHASAANSARQRAAAANGDSHLTNGLLPNGKAASASSSHLANGLTSNSKAQAASLDGSGQSDGKKQADSLDGSNQLNDKTQAASQGGSAAAANGPVKANGAVKASTPKESGPSAGDDAQGAGAPSAPGKGAAAGSKRGLPAAAAAAAPCAGLGSNGVVGVDGGVLHPPSKKARGADEQLQGSSVAEGQQQQQSAQGLHSQDQELQGPGSGVDTSSPGIILSPFAQPSSAGQRGHALARMAAHLSRCHPPTSSGLTSHLSAHLSMHHGHRNQRLARELRVKSRTEVKQHRGQQQEQQEQQEQQQQLEQQQGNEVAQGEGSMDEGLRQQGRTSEGCLHASTYEPLALQSSPQPTTSPGQRHARRGKKQQQQQQQQQERRKAEAEKDGLQAHAPPCEGLDGSKSGSQQQGPEAGHTQPHQPPEKEQQQQQQQQQQQPPQKKQQEQQQQQQSQQKQQQQQLQQKQQQQQQLQQKQQPQQQQQGEGEGEQVLVGADAARLLGSGNMALGGGVAFGQGKPAGVQPWADVDPHVARQQADMLGRQQQKRSRQLDAWDQDYDAGKTKKVRNKGGAGADLHAGGNAFQAFQQQKRGSGNNNKQRRGSKEGKGFSGERNRLGRGRGGGRGGSPRFALRGGGRGRGKSRD